MSVIDRAKAHFDAQGVRCIEVPEWGEEGEPCRIFVTPWTLADQAKLLRASQGKEAEALALVLIFKAMDGEGKPLFTLEDKRALMHEVDAAVVARVANAIMGVEEAEAVGKASTPTGSS